MSDKLQKFMFDAAPVRGEYVTLDATWQAVLARHAYPPAVRALLGEMMAAAALLSANIKFDGALVMQLHGDGPVRMLVVECNADLTMRATAKYEGDIPDNATLAELVNLDGGGRFAITLDPREKMPGQQPYQGIVPLVSHDGPLTDMAQVLEHYMRNSEQLDTRLWLAADTQRAVGVLLQRLPDHGGKMDKTVIELPAEHDEDAWERACQLGGTLSRKELLDTAPETLLHRLFWQENLRAFPAQATVFRCTCSREKVGGMLRMLGVEEAASILSERPDIEVACEFCRQQYRFDPVDVAQLFAGETITAGIAPAPSQHH